ncbi:uncharacterized protein LOC144512532 [Sander vitreus]
MGSGARCAGVSNQPLLLRFFLQLTVRSERRLCSSECESSPAGKTSGERVYSANISFHGLVEELDQWGFNQLPPFALHSGLKARLKGSVSTGCWPSNSRFGNHFILWVFDGSKTEIRVYDSLEKYTLILDILSLAFQNIWRLKEWSISYPDQWRQKDGVNCGVFVCTAAELDIKGTDMTNEPLNQVQLGHHRMYHAACLIADSVPKGKKVRESCMAQAIHACNYYDSTGKGQSRPLYPHVQKDWVKCETCNGWLHKDCACYEPSQSGIFTCGCDLPEPYAFTQPGLTAVRVNVTLFLIY